jgi:phage/plasmid-like protein (TIGR03299 family)
MLEFCVDFDKSIFIGDFMAHDLSFAANSSAEMAFRGVLPWHGLGQRVEDGATLDQWRELAGWMWEAISTPVQYVMGDKLMTSDKDNCLIRSDNGQLLGIVGNQYKPVQPADVVDFFRSMVDGTGYRIETMGTLNHGKKLWAMAGSTDHADDITGRGDIVTGGLLLATSLDGSTPTIVQPTSTRVVCQNTLRIALGETDVKIKVSHRSVFDPLAVKKQLELIDSGYAKFIQSIKELSKMHITSNEAQTLLQGLFEKPSKGLDKASNEQATEQAGRADFTRLLGVPDTSNKTPLGRDKKENRSVVRCLELFEGSGMGASATGVAGTAWGLLNSVTQYVDHEQGRTANNRLDKAWFGTGGQIKDDCFAQLLNRI